MLKTIIGKYIDFHVSTEAKYPGITLLVHLLLLIAILTVSNPYVICLLLIATIPTAFYTISCGSELFRRNHGNKRGNP